MTGIDDLTDALAAKRALRRANGRPNVVTTADPLDRAIVANTLGDLLDWLRKCGVLLGPDGLVQAIEIETYDDLDLAWRVNDAPLFTLIPQDPTEEP